MWQRIAPSQRSEEASRLHLHGFRLCYTPVWTMMKKRWRTWVKVVEHAGRHQNLDALCPLSDDPGYLAVVPIRSSRQDVCGEVQSFFIEFFQGMDDLQWRVLLESIVTNPFYLNGSRIQKGLGALHDGCLGISWLSWCHALTLLSPSHSTCCSCFDRFHCMYCVGIRVAWTFMDLLSRALWISYEQILHEKSWNLLAWLRPYWNRLSWTWMQMLWPCIGR